MLLSRVLALTRNRTTCTPTLRRYVWTEQRWTSLPKVPTKPVFRAYKRSGIGAAIGIVILSLYQFTVYYGYHFPRTFYLGQTSAQMASGPGRCGVGTETQPKGFSDAEIAPFLHPRHPSTGSFFLQQTMMRIKDPRRSLEFYTNALGMTLLKRYDFPSMKFTIYFMGYEDASAVPKDEEERTKWALSRPGTIELTHNYGTEDDPEQKYHNGNSDPRGFGHIGIAVNDVYAACERFEQLGVEFVKRPDDGKMKGLAFIKDPDGYWVEIFNPNSVAAL